MLRALLKILIVVVLSIPLLVYADGLSRMPSKNIVLSGTIEKKVRIINVSALQYRYNPDPIVVMQGESIQIIAQAEDVPHGLAIPAYGINVSLLPHQPKTITFIARKVGEFSIHCSVYCGEGHQEMVSKLIVIKNSEKNNI